MTDKDVTMDAMTYRGYTAAVEYNGDDGIFVGRVMGIRDIIDCEGVSAVELERDFHAAIDSYLKACKNVGKTPDSPSC